MIREPFGIWVDWRSYLEIVPFINLIKYKIVQICFFQKCYGSRTASTAKEKKQGEGLSFQLINKGERRELNPRVMESQPIALTTWLRSP